MKRVNLCSFGVRSLTIARPGSQITNMYRFGVASIVLVALLQTVACLPYDFPQPLMRLRRDAPSDADIKHYYEMLEAQNDDEDDDEGFVELPDMDARQPQANKPFQMPDFGEMMRNFQPPKFDITAPFKKAAEGLQTVQRVISTLAKLLNDYQLWMHSFNRMTVNLQEQVEVRGSSPPSSSSDKHELKRKAKRGFAQQTFLVRYAAVDEDLVRAKCDQPEFKKPESGECDLDKLETPQHVFDVLGQLIGRLQQELKERSEQVDKLPADEILQDIAQVEGELRESPDVARSMERARRIFMSQAKDLAVREAGHVARIAAVNAVAAALANAGGPENMAGPLQTLTYLVGLLGGGKGNVSSLYMMEVQARIAFSMLDKIDPLKHTMDWFKQKQNEFQQHQQQQQHKSDESQQQKLLPFGPWGRR